MLVARLGGRARPLNIGRGPLGGALTAVLLVVLSATAQAVPPPQFGDCSAAVAQVVVAKSRFPRLVEKALPSFQAGRDLHVVQAFCRDLTGDGVDEFVILVNIGMSPGPTPWGIFQTFPKGDFFRLAFHQVLYDTVGDGFRYGRLDVQEKDWIVWLRERSQRRRRGDANCCPTGPKRTRHVFWNGVRFKINARSPGKEDVKLRGEPEPNDFACPELPIINERSACQIYLAPPNKGAGRGLHLLRVGVEGEGGWGWKHIRGKRGFSRKTDWYIEQTIWGGKYEEARRRFVRHYKTATKACTVEVRVSNDRGVGTAFTREALDGFFHVCPDDIQLPWPARPFPAPPML